ncbi:uncharacterized protein [Amphiura filiformis]|uniref:uncharacterized protein n=1 Tax=Amphiura filiformis TaxID=82378 RepID=UPI003B213A08
MMHQRATSYDREPLLLMQIIPGNGDTPEMGDIKSVLASARMKSESFPSLTGKRIVSEVDWSLLQKQTMLLNSRDAVYQEDLQRLLDIIKISSQSRSTQNTERKVFAMR